MSSFGGDQIFDDNATTAPRAAAAAAAAVFVGQEPLADDEGFFGPLYNTWDVPKVLAAASFLLTQIVGNALLFGIVW